MITPPQHIRCDLSGSTATVTIDRPERRNALALRTIGELREAVSRAIGEPGIRVLVLTGAGERAFASGADLDELANAMDSPENAAEYDRQVGALYHDLLNAPLPVVARLQGHAIGGGCLLALACDIRIARQSVTLGLPASRIGLMLSPLEHQLLVRQVGLSRAKLLLFTGRRLTAWQAESWGLVDLVVDDGAFDQAVDSLIEEIVSGAPIAIRAAKKLLHAVSDGGDPEGARACYHAIYGSEDLKEGLRAVKQKRPPVFRER